MSRPAVSRRATGAGVAAAAFLFLVFAGSGGASPVSPPTSLTAVAVSSSQIRLNWADSNTNESAFFVERSLSSTSGFTQIASLPINSTTYTNSGLASGTTYYYRVRVSFKNGTYSTYSNVASARTTSTGTVPAAPSNLISASPSSSQITLSWTDNSTNETGFKVERAAAAAGPWTYIGSTALTGYGDSGLAAGTTYYYRVQAYNSAGNSAYSNTTSRVTQGAALIGVPAAPTGLTAAAVSSTQINLAWADASTNETGFKIERAPSSTGPWAQIATTGTNVASYANTGLAASTAYWYRVRATNASGDSGYSNTASATTSGSTGSRFSRRFGDIADDRAQGIATDRSGNVAITGHFSGAADFGGGQVASFLSPVGPSIDIVVAEYTPAGGYRWARTMGGTASEEGMGAATDGSGNVLVTGYQGSFTVDYGGGLQTTPGGTNDIFVAKYSSAGSWVWSKTVGGYGADQGNAIAADISGNVFVTGYIGMSSIGVNLGGSPIFSVGMSDVFLVKYSASGGHLWSKRFGGAGNDIGLAVGTDGSGNVIVAGTFEGTADFGGGNLTSAGLRDIFVAKYSPTGAHLWSKRFGGTGDEVAYGLAVNSAGDVALTGKFQGSVNFGGTTLTSAGSDDAFVAKLTGASGAHAWSKRFGSTSQDIATGVAVDGTGNVVVAGYFLGSVDFGGGLLTASNIDVFVAKYSSAGTYVWARKYGGASNQIADCVSAAPTGEVSVGGFFAGTIDFGQGTLTVVGTTGAYDGFFAQIGP